MPDRRVQPPMVEPVDPDRCRGLDRLPGAPALPALGMDHLGLEQADRGLHQSIVESVANGPDGAGYASVPQLLGQCDGGVLGEPASE